MAKKQKQQSSVSQDAGLSKAESFTHGMISDLDPHFQIKGSYSDAQNIRLTNSEGDTFTVENIEGNSLFIDLANTYIHTPDDQFQLGKTYPTFFDRGPSLTIETNLELSNRCSIVGHVSYANQLLLMIVGRFEWDRMGGTTSDPISSLATGATYTNRNTQIDRTIFLLLDFDHEFRCRKVTDLRVCYTTSGDQYPDLGMHIDNPVRLEHIIENEQISRIYWTDNKNPLRTLNLKQEKLNFLEVNALDITPLMKPSQPVLSATLFGSLPVGVYQYCYKYISENGGESTFSPLSNLYHVSDQSFSNTTSYGGGPKGNLGTQGFQIDVYDLDNNFEYIELYSLLYDDQNQAPRVAVVSRNQIVGGLATFQHTVWNNEVPNGLEEVLIESNTWDICKDIAIKDNILFAANLRQKRNWISEQEWNVKVMRWRIIPGKSGVDGQLDAMLTTNDPLVKHYNGLGSINNNAIDYSVQDYNGHYCGYGQLLGAPGTMYDSTASINDHLNYDGTLNNPMWTTALASQRSEKLAHGFGNSNKFPQFLSYRYLSDRMTLGAESFDYSSNSLGGCRISFGIEEKTGDISQNAKSSPFISATSTGESSPTEFENVNGTGFNPSAVPIGNNKFKTSMSLGGSQDPHLAGDKRGYQRAEVYRFGVQTYDLNGSPGNVLWIGDIETPHQHDLLRMIDIKQGITAGSSPGVYSPYRRTIGSSEGLVENKDIKSHEFVRDHRLSYIYGHAIPNIDIEWFTDRKNTYGARNFRAYVDYLGQQINADWLPLTGSDYSYGPFGKSTIKATPLWSKNNGIPNDSKDHDDIHHLFDLYVAFEFIIPKDVCQRISGFRVVRAVRNEEDRRIIQQGLLNQTAQYGNAEEGQKYGYDDSLFCQEDNKGFGDDPVFVNAYIDQNPGGNTPAADPTLPEQPEYNVYLNGYLGLAENSHIAFYDDKVTDGKATIGGNTEPHVFYWPEREDMKKGAQGGLLLARYQGVNISSAHGPGTYGLHKRHSAYFGSYDKMSGWDTSGNEVFNSRTAKHISGSIFTLDSPDSAFGIRPYAFREGDMLRIDSTLKLTDEVRYKNYPTTTQPQSYFTNCRDQTLPFVQGGGYVANDADANGNIEEWAPAATSYNKSDSMTFCASKKVGDSYEALVGKYYCYDPYFGIGMELNGGDFAGIRKEGDGGARPVSNYGWQLPIASSKEISDGEIIPNGFFKVSKRAKEGLISGFSNNTLGFVKKAHKKDTKSEYFVFGSVTNKLPFIQKAGTEHTEVKPGDYNYDTVSTIQMGLRSIIIEVDNRASQVRKSGPKPEDSFFEHRPHYRYSSWFAPVNLSALYEHGSWMAVETDNMTYGTGNVTTYNGSNSLPYRSNFLTNYSKYKTVGNQSHGSQTSHEFTNHKSKDLVPFKHLCSIVRNVIPYGGFTKGSIEKTRYIPCGNFHPVTRTDQLNYGGKQGHVSQVFGGDTFVNLYSHQKTGSPYMKNSASRWQVFPVESFVNTDMRSGLTLNSGDTVIGKDINEAPYSNDWLYNSVYSQENSIKSSIMIDEKTIDDSLDLPYEIAYSNTKILGQKTDAFRQFPINQFHDMEGLYGEINRIVNFKNEIYVLQDTAFAKLLVNPISMLSDDSGTSLFTGTGETVEHHEYISTKYGTRHRFSVATSEKSLYFVDSSFARLFKYDTEKLISLGDALGQRNYLNEIIKEWNSKSYRICPLTVGNGPHIFNTNASLQTTTHSSSQSLHGNAQGLLDSHIKLAENFYTTKYDTTTGAGPIYKQSRNFLSDNPLKFLGISSVYDYRNKELLVTFHNSHWADLPDNAKFGSLKDQKRMVFANTEDNHYEDQTKSGDPLLFSETIVYSEAINAFTSKYSVAPPQWLDGGKGSFLLCPENEIDVVSIANFLSQTTLTSTFSAQPYQVFGASSNYSHRKRRCNPLRLWLWDHHREQKKTHFFGKKDDYIRKENTFSNITIPSLGVTPRIYSSGTLVHNAGTSDVADESYIVKTINAEASSSKVFDNAQIVMTPEHLDFTFIDYTTDITHDTINIKNVLDNELELLDKIEQLVINKRWDFNGTTHGWYLTDPTGVPAPIINANSTITLPYIDDSTFRSPNNFNGQYINLHGKYNNIIRMRVKRTLNANNWTGQIFWTGHDPIRKERGDYLRVFESSSRMASIQEPELIDNDFVIIEWDMSGIGGVSSSGQHSGPTGSIDGAFWDDCIIEQIRIDLSGNSGSSTFDVDWIEIGGLKAHKYIDGILKAPLRTEKSKRRTRGTWAKIKYSAKTTDKFNIFAILAKYRKTY